MKKSNFPAQAIHFPWKKMSIDDTLQYHTFNLMQTPCQKIIMDRVQSKGLVLCLQIRGGWKYQIFCINTKSFKPNAKAIKYLVLSHYIDPSTKPHNNYKGWQIRNVSSHCLKFKTWSINKLRYYFCNLGMISNNKGLMNF